MRPCAKGAALQSDSPERPSPAEALSATPRLRARSKQRTRPHQPSASLRGSTSAAASSCSRLNTGRPPPASPPSPPAAAAAPTPARSPAARGAARGAKCARTTASSSARRAGGIVTCVRAEACLATRSSLSSHLAPVRTAPAWPLAHQESGATGPRGHGVRPRRGERQCSQRAPGTVPPPPRPASHGKQYNAMQGTWLTHLRVEQRPRRAAHRPQPRVMPHPAMDAGPMESSNKTGQSRNSSSRAGVLTSPPPLVQHVSSILF